jgi:hypothetical protein
MDTKDYILFNGGARGAEAVFGSECRTPGY